MIRNILEYLEKTAERLPDKIAFSAPEGNITFAELENIAKRIGTYLSRFGKCPVAVMMQKTPVSVAAFMGAVYSGNFYTPIDVTMPKERILSILHTLNPGVMVIDEKSRKVADGLGYEGEIVVLEEIIETETDEEVYSFSPARALDFWGICWENDTYNIWIQSSDIGDYCYKYDTDTWILDEEAQMPDYIVTRHELQFGNE